MKRWTVRCARGSIESSGFHRPSAVSPRGTCPAIFAGRSDTSNACTALIPDSPSTSRFQQASAPHPSGVTAPMPVTTTRLISVSGLVAHGDSGRIRPAPHVHALVPAATSGGVLLDEVDRVLHGHDLLRRIVRDLHPELFQ